MRELKVNPVVVVCLIDGSVAFGAPFLNTFFTRSDVALQAGAGLIAAATFLGVWTAQRKRVGQARPAEAMRDAIAASFVLTYLVAVGWTAFFNYITAGPTGKLSPLTESFITNFTALTGIVVGSYFGLTAIQQVTQSQERRSRGHEPPPAPPREEEEEAHPAEGEAERGLDRPRRS